jgi:hypothetical protein
MDWNDLLMLTLGAVAPYVTVAAACWNKAPTLAEKSADAPT